MTYSGDSIIAALLDKSKCVYTIVQYADSIFNGIPLYHQKISRHSIRLIMELPDLTMY